MSENSFLELTRIIQNSAYGASSEEQVQMIVDAISDVIAVDVCSLYRQNQDKDMVLMASHGLSTNHPVIIPATLGLVGRVVKLRHSINMINPDQHPDYYYVSQSCEEQFHSFCGVPLVHQGDIIGVLVVQSRRAEMLATDQETFFTTLAAHLALLVTALPESNLQQIIHNERRAGISGAPGIAIGNVKIASDEGLMAVADTLCENIASEKQQWELLKAAVVSELQKERDIVEKVVGESLAVVLDAYQLLLQDRSFGARIEKEIDAGKTLPWAIKQTVRFFSEKFLAMDDPYLKARHEDIEQLGDKLYQVWRGKGTELINSADNSPLILAGHQVSVSDIVSLPTEQLAGIICFYGGALSHIAVFANAMGIPAVMGVGDLALKNGELIIVDGESAHVILRPGETVLDEYTKLINNRESFERHLSALHDQPATTQDAVTVKLLANSGLQADIMPGLRNGADGIGLYRTEIPFMVRQNLPSEDEQTNVYRRVINAYQNKPVYIRTLDIGADKPLPYFPVVYEENPALGLRGIRFTLDNLQLLMTQFRAIMRAAAGRADVHVLIPMIGSTQELDKSIELLNQAYQQLLDEGKSIIQPKLGIMVEVPGAISLLPFWADKLDFISIGSNDLSQYLLAIDRNNPLVTKVYDSLHPAVIHEIRRIIRVAKECKLPVSLCGEMASDPIAVMLLLGMGVRHLSMSSAKLPLVKWLIRSLSISDTETFLQAALKLDNAQAIRELGQKTMKDAGIVLEKHLEK